MSLFQIFLLFLASLATTGFLIVCAALWSARRNAPYWDETNREFVDEDTVKARNARLFNVGKNIK